jgi:hypothetical protein
VHGSVSVTGGAVDGNATTGADANGGGIFATGFLSGATPVAAVVTLTDTSLSNNAASGASAEGSGAYVVGPAGTAATTSGSTVAGDVITVDVTGTAPSALLRVTAAQVVAPACEDSVLSDDGVRVIARDPTDKEALAFAGGFAVHSADDAGRPGHEALVDGDERLVFLIGHDAQDASFEFAELEGHGRIKMTFFDDGEAVAWRHAPPCLDADGRLTVDPGVSFDKVELHVGACDDLVFSVASASFSVDPDLL